MMRPLTIDDLIRDPEKAKDVPNIAGWVRVNVKTGEVILTPIKKES